MKKVLILLGPTGVGKTGASIMLAEHLETEIISADSMQIYKGMDIGTAKPTEQERASIKHHMIDVVSPSEPFSVGQYVEAVTPIIKDLLSRQKNPLIVGGTGLYIKALTRGIFSGPSADWELRGELLAIEHQEKGALHSYLLHIDPQAAEKISSNDIKRIVRAIEVCLKSHEKMSLLQEKLTRPLPFEFIKIGLTRQRQELYSIIEQRVDKMIQAGLIKEVETILRMNPDKTPLQAIGYKETAGYLQGAISKEEAISLVKRNSKRYAKRQFTWFRKEEGIHWIDATGVFSSREIYLLIKAALMLKTP